MEFKSVLEEMSDREQTFFGAENSCQTSGGGVKTLLTPLYPLAQNVSCILSLVDNLVDNLTLVRSILYKLGAYPYL